MAPEITHIDDDDDFPRSTPAELLFDMEDDIRRCDAYARAMRMMGSAENLSSEDNSAFAEVGENLEGVIYRVERRRATAWKRLKAEKEAKGGPPEEEPFDADRYIDFLRTMGIHAFVIDGDFTGFYEKRANVGLTRDGRIQLAEWQTRLEADPNARVLVVHRLHARKAFWPPTSATVPPAPAADAA